jgi:FAD synthase
VKVAHSVEELAPARRAAAIGTFDGVHLGHRHVIEAARAAGADQVLSKGEFARRLPDLLQG